MGLARTGDAYIGPVALPEGSYLVGVSSAAYQPRAKVLSSFGVEPINSIRRIVDTGFGSQPSTALPPVVPGFAFTDNGTELESTPFDLGGYAAEDLPNAVSRTFCRPDGHPGPRRKRCGYSSGNDDCRR